MTKAMKEIILQALNARLTVIARNRQSASARFQEVYDLDKKDVEAAIEWVKAQKTA